MSNSSFRDAVAVALRPHRARRSSASASTTATTRASRRWSRRRRRCCSASSRTRCAATATRSCCRTASATSTREAELALVIGRTASGVVEGRRARVRRGLDVRERRVGARLPVRRRAVVPRQEPRHVLPDRPAGRAARRARRERPADPAAAERRDAAGLAHEQADLRHPDARLVRERGDDARARRPDPDRHARGRRLLPRPEGRAAPTATSSRSRSRGSACCGTRSAPRERAPRPGSATASLRGLWTNRHELDAASVDRHVTISPLGSIA